MSDCKSLSLPYEHSEPSTDLAEILDAWPNLPELIRAGILAVIRSSSGEGR